jgi:hypothetical protein
MAKGVITFKKKKKNIAILLALASKTHVFLFHEVYRLQIFVFLENGKKGLDRGGKLKLIK